MIQANNNTEEIGHLNMEILGTGPNEEILNRVFAIAHLLVTESFRINSSRYTSTLHLRAELEQLFDVLGILIHTRTWEPLDSVLGELLGILGNLLRERAITTPDFDRLSKHIRTIQEFLELIDKN